jgi:beta-glucosidase
MRVLDGGWSYSWQGDAVNRYTSQYRTVLKAIQNVHGTANVVFREGVQYSVTGKYYDDSDVGIAAAVDAAKTVDVVILVVGENSYTEKPGDLQDLALSDNQLKLARALIDTGKPVVLVLSEGRPRIINRFVDDCKAVLQLYLPGNFGGDALADILFGKVNPSGRLPYNYPRYPHSLVNYWHKLAEEQTASPGAYNYESDYSPLWEFGTGLSYTTFQYSGLTLSSSTMHTNDTLTVSVTVKNTGARAGKEAVLLYTSDLYASTAPDARRLRKFTKIELAAGASQVVTFKLVARDLSFVNTANKRITEPGEFRIRIGSLSQTFRFQK